VLIGYARIHVGPESRLTERCPSRRGMWCLYRYLWRIAVRTTRIEQALKECRKGDTLVVLEIGSLGTLSFSSGRNSQNLIATMSDCDAGEYPIPAAPATTGSFPCLWHLAEFERDLIRTNQRGLSAARAEAKGGRPVIPNSEGSPGSAKVLNQ